MIGKLNPPTDLSLGKNPGQHWMGGWVGLRAGLIVLGKRKISYPYHDSNPGQSSPSPFAVYICGVCNSYAFL